MKRFLLTSFALAALTSCSEPRRVISDLPSPVMHTYAVKPAPMLEVEHPVAPVKRELPIGPRTIIVDPGHGGKDPGTQGVSAITEKEFNLLLAAELNRALTQRGAKVVSTRTTDKFVTLEQRALVARRSRADLFVSIHADWIRKRHSTGATLYIARSPSAKSIRAADCIAAAFRAAGIKCNGIRRRDFRVLVEHPQPAVLIECGYMSNWADARQLNSAAYRTRLVDAITDGIATHFTR